MKRIVSLLLALTMVLLSLTGWLPSVWLSFIAAEAICIPLAIALWKRNWGGVRKTIGYTAA